MHSLRFVVGNSDPRSQESTIAVKSAAIVATNLWFVTAMGQRESEQLIYKHKLIGAQQDLGILLPG
jgi:hypothetical protein